MGGRGGLSILKLYARRTVGHPPKNENRHRGLKHEIKRHVGFVRRQVFAEEKEHENGDRGDPGENGNGDGGEHLHNE